MFLHPCLFGNALGLKLVDFDLSSIGGTQGERDQKKKKVYLLKAIIIIDFWLSLAHPCLYCIIQA